MILRNYAYRIIGAVCAIAFVACVDESFNLDNVSKEVTLGGGTTTLPLGQLKDRSIGDLLGGQTIVGLETDEEGNLRYSFEGEGGEVSVEGITTEFTIPEIESVFEVDYPKFELEMVDVVIDEEEDLEIKGLDDYVIPGMDVSDYGYYIPEGIDLPTIGCEFMKEFNDEKLHIDFEVPKEIDNITKLIFKNIENNHTGAPIHLRLHLNDLASINGGGMLNVNLTLTGGEFKILDAENNAIENSGNIYKAEYTIEEYAEYIDFAVYVESLTNTTGLDDEHHLDIPLTLAYDMNFEIQPKPGYVKLNKMPHLEVSADFELADAEVALNGDVNIVECGVANSSPIEISGLPKELLKISRVDMKQDDSAYISLFAHGLSWMGDLTENIEVAVTLPKFLKMHNTGNGGYTYDEATGVLTTNIALLDEGVKIALDAFDFGAEGLQPDKYGKMTIDFSPYIVAHFVEGTEIGVGSLLHDEDLLISVGIEEAHLNIESVTGCVDYAYEMEQQFKLAGLDQFNMQIEGLGIKPVIEVNITHPLTMEAVLKGSITPYSDGVAVADNKVSFNNVVIDAAEYRNGTIRPADVKLIIAHESLRSQYDDSIYTFVPCDVTKLLLGKMPEELNIKFEIGVDSTKEHTIHVSDTLAISYDYKILVPFEVDDSLEVYYNGALYGLNPLFETIAGYDIKVGDVTLIATVTNTTPLELAADIVLKDANGEVTASQVVIDEDAKICGSSDGVTPAVSVVRLLLDLGKDGRVSNVADIDAIELSLAATSAAAENSSVPLNNDQYIGVKLQIELVGGITIDLEKLNLPVEQ